MLRCSAFIPNIALFGCYPTQEEVNQLEQIGVRYFIDLTEFGEENIIPYQTKYHYIKYPIPDHHIPGNWKSFAQLVVKICYLIQELTTVSTSTEDVTAKIYCHCKGGHGRSGLLTSVVFCHYYNMSPSMAIRLTTQCHATRPVMREKWRLSCSPHGKKQRDFVHRFFRPLRFSHNVYNKYTIGFSNISMHSVVIPSLGTFPNAFSAFQAFRDPTNLLYVYCLFHGEFHPELIRYHDPNWEEKKIDYMYRVLELKFRQHSELAENLMNTGLRPIEKISQKDTFWGKHGLVGLNWHGRLLSKLRDQLLYEDFQSHIST